MHSMFKYTVIDHFVLLREDLNSKSTLKTLKFFHAEKIMLHVDIIYLTCRGRNMTLDTVVMYDVNFIFQEIDVSRKKY